jgi:hypothetical protein
MLNNTVTEAMQLLTDYLAAADPLTTPDNQFASTQALAANLANQLYQLDPCTDGGGFGSSERLAQVKQLKEKIKTAAQKALPKSSILLYPNPFTDNTTLLFSNDQKEAFQLTVVDAFGKVVYQEMNITGTQLQLTNQHLAAGVYSIQLNSLNHHYSTTMEIIKQ